MASHYDEYYEKMAAENYRLFKQNQQRNQEEK